MKTQPFCDYVSNGSELFQILKYLPRIETEGPWIAGGSVWKAIEGLTLDCDIDFFFTSPQQFEVYLRIMKSVPYGPKIIKETSNGYNTTFDFHIYEKGKINKTQKVQFICAVFSETIEALIDSFDFTVCQFAFDGKTLYTGDNSFTHLKERKIILNNVFDVYASMIHLKKYIDRGFVIPPEETEKFNNLQKSPAKPYFKTLKRAIRRSIYPSGVSDELIDDLSALATPIAVPTDPVPVSASSPAPQVSYDSVYIRPTIPSPTPIQEPSSAIMYMDLVVNRPMTTVDVPTPLSTQEFAQRYTNTSINPSYFSTITVGSLPSANTPQSEVQAHETIDAAIAALSPEARAERQFMEVIENLPIESVNINYENVFTRIEYPAPTSTVPTAIIPTPPEISDALNGIYERNR